MVAQAIVLLLWDVLVLGVSFAAGLLEAVRPASKRHSSQSRASKELGGLNSILASRSDASLFVELLVFGTLLTGLVVSQLLRVLHAPAASSQKQDKEQAQGVSVEADGSHEAIAADKKKHGGRKRRGGTQRRGRKWMVAVGLLVAVLELAVTAAVRPALWVLRFALSSWRRVALLGYWGLLLAGALPFMDWVSGRVPTIIVRKVRCCGRNSRTKYCPYISACRPVLSIGMSWDGSMGEVCGTGFERGLCPGCMC